MTGNIHSSAIISSDAKIGKGVKIGPYCVVEGDVVLEDNVELKSHVVVESGTEIGENTVIYPFACIGGRPQDLKYNNEKTKLIIGKNNQIRESCLIHRGTVSGNDSTIIGDNNLIMGHVHIAHDCVIGNNVVISHSSKLAGHVIVEDYAILGGQSGFHQFCRVGKLSLVGGHSAVTHDVPPFTIYASTRTEQVINGINFVGLRRSGYCNKDIFVLKNCVSKVLNNKSQTREESIKELIALDEYKNNELARYFASFVLRQDKHVRGISAELAKQ